MNLITPSVTLTNLITFLCRWITCDPEYQTPVAERASAPSSSSLNNIFRLPNLPRPNFPLPNFPIPNPFEQNSIINGNNEPPPGYGKVPPEANTTLGLVRGYYMRIVRGNTISAFEGIPFAEPPLGNLRFKDPVPKAPWKGHLNAISAGSPCLQLFYGRLRGEESCLFLNVYTKDVNPKKLYPVVIFIHGGFWIAGSGSYYGPSYLLENDVILVTFNYRLGSLGFFSTGDLESPGNFGLKDQAAVIEWCHSNIQSFGGDPNRIILTGTSAGGVSTHLNMMSDYPSKNKITSAISMSGTAYNVWGLNKLSTAISVSMRLAEALGCPSGQGSEAVMKCMRAAPANAVVANQLVVFPTGFFIPHIEPNITGAFLTHTPDDAYSNGKVAKIPWIASMTSRELNLPVTALQENLIVTFLRTAFSSDLASLLSFRRKGVDEEEVRKKIAKFYTGGSGSINELSRQEFSKIATHRYFSVPIRKAIQMHSQIAPTYGTVFNYSSNLGRAGRLGFSPTTTGTVHGDDLVYFLNSTTHPPIRRYDSHFAITKLLVNLYGNFAKFGEPIFTTEDDEEYRIWEVIKDKNRLRFLWIDEEVTMIDDPYKKVAEFWEGLKIPDTTPSFSLL